jgi:3-methyladenine DNA glycosylase AlkD
VKRETAEGGRRPPGGVVRPTNTRNASGGRVPPSSAATAEAILTSLRAQRSERNIAGQRRYGITPRTEMLGISAPTLRAIAREHRRDHALALELWKLPVHEARILAVLVEDWRQVTVAQMEAWARDFDCWPLVDGACTQLFNYTPFAIGRVRGWTRRRDEFVKRAGFVLMAGLAVHQKKLPDQTFLAFLPILRRGASDERNFVKKAVNWALRQIGKRNPRLRGAAIVEAHRILALDTPAARWIARDALRELQG